MVSFSQFAMEDGSPIYVQIIGFIKQGIASGAISDQEEIPSRRTLSALLGVNPNTVQKAYRILEEESIIESRSGAKSFVTVTVEQVSEIRAQLLESAAGGLVNMMKQLGVSKAQALETIEMLWKE